MQSKNIALSDHVKVTGKVQRKEKATTHRKEFIPRTTALTGKNLKPIPSTMSLPQRI